MSQSTTNSNVKSAHIMIYEWHRWEQNRIYYILADKRWKVCYGNPFGAQKVELTYSYKRKSLVSYWGSTPGHISTASLPFAIEKYCLTLLFLPFDCYGNILADLWPRLLLKRTRWSLTFDCKRKGDRSRKTSTYNLHPLFSFVKDVSFTSFNIDPIPKFWNYVIHIQIYNRCFNSKRNSELSELKMYWNFRIIRIIELILTFSSF